MTDLSSKVCLVRDNGLFSEIAVTLSKKFKHVYYSTAWESHSPRKIDLLSGQGIDNVERVDDIWEVVHKHSPDELLCVFPDVFHAGLQWQLSDMGYRVWGSRKGDQLELQREDAKQLFKQVGLAVGPYKVIKGVDNLRKHLKEHDRLWVKLSFTRGDMETWFHENYVLSEAKINKIQYDLGANGKAAEFILEEPIEQAVEIGYDGYSVDGEFPSAACVGLEIKGKSYLGHFVKSEAMPAQLLEINRAMAPALREFSYRNFFCVENRITEDGKAWMLDPCCRFGSPPSELLQMLYSNLAEIMWEGGGGKCIDPVPAGKWGAELVIHSSWAEKEWQAVQFPPELRDHFKFRNFVIDEDGEYHIMPQSVQMTDVGAVVAVGDTMKEACDRVKEIAKEIQGMGLETEPHALDSAGEEIEKLKSFGVTL